MLYMKFDWNWPLTLHCQDAVYEIWLKLAPNATYQVSRQSTHGSRVIFLRFLPYMGIVAILAMRPGLFEQIFNLPLPGCCIWNLIEIDSAVSEEKLFEKVAVDHGGRTTIYTISSRRAFGSGELKIYQMYSSHLIIYVDVQLSQKWV